MNDTTTQNPPVATGDGTGTLHITPGEWVRINWPGSQYDKREGTVKRPSDHGTSFLVEFEDGTNNWFGTHQIEAMPQLWPANATMDEMREVVRRLSNDLAEEKARSESRLQSLQREQERLTEQQRHYRHDMQHWESTMREVKDEQTWCDDGTNRVIQRLNDGFIGGWEIDEYRKRERVTVRIRGEVYREVEVYVDPDDDADDPDNWYDSRDSEDALGEEFVSEQLDEEYQRNGWDETECDAR